MTVEICWDYISLLDHSCTQGLSDLGEKRRIIQQCSAILWGIIASKNKRAKTKFWSLSLKVSLSVGLGGRGQAKGCCNASCLSIVVRCGHVVWYRYRYKRLLKYQILQKLVTCFPQIVMFLVTPHTRCYRVSIFTEIRAIFDSFALICLILLNLNNYFRLHFCLSFCTHVGYT